MFRQSTPLKLNGPKISDFGKVDQKLEILKNFNASFIKTLNESQRKLIAKYSRSGQHS